MIRGSYRHLITLHRPDTYDIANEIETWKQIAAPRSKVKVLDSLEGTGIDLQAVEIVEFRIPYIKAVELDYKDMVVVFRGREYEVKGVKNVDYLDKELIILARNDEHSLRMS